MPLVTYVLANGERKTVDVRSGYTVMEGALENDVEGIVAECGGSCSCSTCHVYVDAEWLGRLNPMQEDEEGLVEFAYEPNETSRLSCQIIVNDDLDGLVVTVPQEQVYFP